MMKKKIAASLIGIGTLGATAMIAPSIASAQILQDTPEIEETVDATPRVSPLDELVTEGVLTQDQADQIRERFEARRTERGDLAGKHGRHGGERDGGERDLTALTDATGLTAEQLQEGRAAGQTLAEIAEANGIDPAAVVDALVAEANARLDAKVADGSITAEQADARRAELSTRIEARLNGERPEGDFGRGRGHRGHHGFGADAAAAEDA